MWDKFLFLRRHGNTQNNFSGSVRHSFTVHFANEIYDNGPIIAQRALAVEEGWDVDTLEEHIHAIEHVLYPEVVQMLADGRVHVLESGKVAIDAPRG